MRASIGRIAATLVALGGLSAVALAPSTAAAATKRTTAKVISSADNAELGTILVAGNTVYTLKASATECLKAWPPVLLPHRVKTATAGSGVDASKLGKVAAAHGVLQVTYAGKRLYWSAKDKAPGDVHGNVKNKWGKWSPVVMAQASADPNATVTTPAPATAAPDTAAPDTAAPNTAAPDTTPADTAPADTAPPATAAPATEPPAPQPTSPPRTQPPATNPPSNGGVGF
jgi:predicted lipoprotein with Yx(FWY)xxD motif